jgi:hypothetical protein
MKPRHRFPLIARPALAFALLWCLAWPAAAADQCVEPFNGKDLAGWKFLGAAERSKWVVGTAALEEGNPAAIHVTPGGQELINARRSVDIYTEDKFGDCLIEVEVMVPKGSNSGIYLMGNYEVQVLDSFGRQNVNRGDMGAIYGQAAPTVNASKAPGQWQAFAIDFRAPRFDAAGKKIANARMVKCTLNGQVIHDNVEIDGPTGGPMGPETASGPLRFQGDHGPVAFRNIKIKPLGPGR